MRKLFILTILSLCFSLLRHTKNEETFAPRMEKVNVSKITEKIFFVTRSSVDFEDDEPLKSAVLSFLVILLKLIPLSYFSITSLLHPSLFPYFHFPMILIQLRN